MAAAQASKLSSQTANDIPTTRPQGLHWHRRAGAARDAFTMKHLWKSRVAYARDGSGTYSLPQAAFVPGTTIETTKVNSNFSDIGAALTQSISKDGQTAFTANQPMGGFKFTDVAVASSGTDYARADQVIGSPLDYADDSGTATAYAIAPSPGISAYAVGQRFAFKAGNANSGADPTLDVNSVGAGIIYWPDGSSLIAGDIPADAQIVVQVATEDPTFHLQTPRPTFGFTTGDAKITIKSVADTGWVMMNDGTIGSATSGATARANADTQALYTLFWNNVSDTYAPVTGGRGANAAADFAANKPIALTKQLGRALAISGAGSGLTSRALGQTVGEETHALTAAENGPHAHTSDNALPWAKANNDAFFVSPGTVGGAFIGFDSGTTASSGSGTAHNNMQPTAFWNVMIKL